MNIRFEPVPRNEFGDFKKDVKEIFAIGVIEHFGMPDDGEPVPDRDVDEALYHPKADVFYVYQGNRRVGGVVLTIDKETHRNKMDLFYIYPDCHSRTSISMSTNADSTLSNTSTPATRTRTILTAGMNIGRNTSGLKS